MSKFIKIFILILNCSYSFQFSDNFHEELLIKQFPSNQINTYFQFTTQWNRVEDDTLQHTNLIARQIAEIISIYKIKELHISLTHGLWRYENWGYPTIDAAPGAEVWAWFDYDNGTMTDEDIDIQWKNLCSSLSGLLCASLSFIDETNTMVPEFSFRPVFNIDRNQKNNRAQYLRYSTLPHEIVCTENLTPWKKLLPCSSDNGFASLLNSDKIYGTTYHSIGIHVRELCKYDSGKCVSSTLEVKQTVNLVFDDIISGGRDWSIRKLFGHGLMGFCTLSSSSKLYIDITQNNFNLTAEPTRIIKSSRGGNEQILAEFDIKADNKYQIFSIAAIYEENTKQITLVSPPPLLARRFILGIGQERGRILTKITNGHWAPLNIVLQENIPWFLPVYLHTMSLKVGNNIVKPIAVKYIPGLLRARPYHLEVVFQIPARKTLEFSIDFDYIFLKWLEYPPDANHGHYIGSAVLTSILPVARNYTSVPIDGTLFSDGFNASRSGYIVQIRTESLLITLPTPDFSMPYNVICLACTVVALAFGPIHNMATKKLKIQKEGEPQSFLGRLKQKLFKKKEKTEKVD